MPDDAVAAALGMVIVEERPGRAVITMTVRDDMVNGLGVCHGGMIFTLADTAMAYASLTTAGRSVLHDTTVTAEDGATIAMFRGRTVTASR